MSEASPFRVLLVMITIGFLLGTALLIVVTRERAGEPVPADSQTPARSSG